MTKLLRLTIIVIILFVCNFIFVNSIALSDERPEVGKYAKVYKGGEGLYVTVLRIGPREKEESLFLLEGVDHPFDGKVMVAKKTRHNKKTEFTIQVNGKNYVVFIKRGSTVNYVYLGRHDDPTNVEYNEALSRNIKPQHFLTRFLKQ